MPERYLFPRLPAAAAKARLAGILGRTAPELTELASCRDSHAVFGATGGTRIPEAWLEQLRDQMLRLAVSHGYPEPKGKDAYVSFDQAAAALLVDGLPICNGEASRDDVWAFLALTLMPDIATWRFPDQQEGRLMGGVRNVFQRIWWRGRMLRDPSRGLDPYWLLQLPEDALVGLMERPALSSNPKVALAIGKAIDSLARTTPSASREDAWRAAYKRIRQRFVLTNFEFLTDRDLETAIQEATIGRPTERVGPLPS